MSYGSGQYSDLPASVGSTILCLSTLFTPKRYVMETLLASVETSRIIKKVELMIHLDVQY